MYTAMMAAVLLLAPFMQNYPSLRKKYIWISCFMMFVVCGLRDVYSIGIDSASSYIRIFRESGEATWGEHFQNIGQESNVAFNMLMKLVYDLTSGDYQAFIILYSAFVMSVFARFIHRYSVNPVESFAYFWGLLCYSFLLDSLKQGIAMAFVTLAFDAIVEKKPVRFYLLTFIGFLFHAPALIFIPAYLIASMKIGGSYLFVLAALLGGTYYFRNDILSLMLQFYNTELHDFEMRFLANKVLIMLVIVVAALILRPPKKSSDRIYNIILKFMGIAIVIQTFASFNNTFERLANYYFQFAVVFIPLVFQQGRYRSGLPHEMETAAKTLAPWAFGAFGVWRFANYIQSTSWIWLPFRFYFQK